MKFAWRNPGRKFISKCRKPLISNLTPHMLNRWEASTADSSRIQNTQCYGGLLDWTALQWKSKIPTLFLCVQSDGPVLAGATVPDCLCTTIRFVRVKFNLDYLLEMMWEHLDLFSIYTKKPGKHPNFNNSSILRKGKTMKNVSYGRLDAVCPSRLCIAMGHKYQLSATNGPLPVVLMVGSAVQNNPDCVGLSSVFPVVIQRGNPRSVLTLVGTCPVPEKSHETSLANVAAVTHVIKWTACMTAVLSRLGLWVVRIVRFLPPPSWWNEFPFLVWTSCRQTTVAS